MLLLCTDSSHKPQGMGDFILTLTDLGNRTDRLSLNINDHIAYMITV